jgi:quinol monooxygenase YgiN
MTFRTEAAAQFLEIFEQYQNQIRAAEGCCGLKLLIDANDPRIFFTYSLWEDESFLEIYRYSATFAAVWPQVKPLFAAPAEAWTTSAMYEL